MFTVAVHVGSSKTFPPIGDDPNVRSPRIAAPASESLVAFAILAERNSALRYALA